jgi:hypothetical protein
MNVTDLSPIRQSQGPGADWLKPARWWAGLLELRFTPHSHRYGRQVRCVLLWRCLRPLVRNHANLSERPSSGVHQAKKP